MFKYDPAEQSEFKQIRQETADIFSRLSVGNHKGRTIAGRDLLCRLMELGHVEVVARYAIELMEQRQELLRLSGKTIPSATYGQTVQLAQWVSPKNQERKRSRRPSKTSKPRKLTTLQTEAIQIVGEYKGNIAEAARRLNKDRKTIEEAYKSGLAKLGKVAVQRGTRTFPRDRRGQVDLGQDDDRRG